ncbi:MAG: hypothetical protein IMY86_13940 [Chloroflexi bacterium]|nr:hypothetical protein [Chloroflexota bacterium]
MAIYVSKDLKYLVDGYDLSPAINELTLDASFDAPESTCYGSSSRTRASGGLADTRISFHGFWDANTASFKIDDVMDAARGTKKNAMVCPKSKTEGDPGYITQNIVTAVAPITGSVGEIIGITSEAAGAEEIVRGIIMASEVEAEDPGSTGTIRELGAVTATQRVYAQLQVYAASGTLPTMDVTVKSDAAESFLSPTTQLTFTQATGVVAEWKSKAGAITDTWWRVDFAIADTTPKFTFIVTVGIQ